MCAWMTTWCVIVAICQNLRNTELQPISGRRRFFSEFYKPLYKPLNSGRNRSEFLSFLVHVFKISIMASPSTLSQPEHNFYNGLWAPPPEDHWIQWGVFMIAFLEVMG